jgi:hypothetical protein
MLIRFSRTISYFEQVCCCFRHSARTIGVLSKVESAPVLSLQSPSKDQVRRNQGGWGEGRRARRTGGARGARDSQNDLLSPVDPMKFRELPPALNIFERAAGAFLLLSSCY